MPRTTRKSTPRKSAAQRAADAAAAARAARPFAADSTAPYGSLDADAKLAVAESIRDAKLAGASGNEMRDRFGENLTGPARRKVLREHGFGSPATIARSYAAYRDGEPRSGTRHAREHGARAGELRAAQADADAAAMPLADARKLLRDAGATVPAVRKGDRSKLDAAAAAVLLAQRS